MVFAWLSLDYIDLALLAIGGFVGITALVRLMRIQRDAILDDLQQQIAREKERRRIKKRRQAQRELREEIRRKRAKRPD